jgi:hypothetical protein
MINKGKIIISYATNGKDDNYFWRNVMSNPFNTHVHINYEMDLLANYCEMAFVSPKRWLS